MITERKESEKREQSLFLHDRKELEICGVKEVIRFDEESAVFAVEEGTLTVEGTGLHVQALEPDRGRVTLSGKVDSLFYVDETSSVKGEKGGLFSRLFH